MTTHAVHAHQQPTFGCDGDFGATLYSLWAALATAWRNAAERRAAARSDAQYFAYAQFDPRIQADLQAARGREEMEQEMEQDALDAAAINPVEIARKLPGAAPMSSYDATRGVRLAH